MIQLLRHKKAVGFRLFWYDTVNSTNDVLKEMAMQGETEGAVVVAECQTAGRGRFERRWLSPKGKGLYFSLLLQPRPSADIIDFLPIIAAVAVADALRRLFRLKPQIKWPNDILLSGRKVCGILCESKRRAAAVFAVVGIGINVEAMTDNCPVELRNRMIALNTVSETPTDKFELLEAVLQEFNRVYQSAGAQRHKVIRRWSRYCCHLNKEVRIRHQGINQTGWFRGITPTGAAVIELPTSESAVITSGEFSLEECIPCC